MDVSSHHDQCKKCYIEERKEKGYRACKVCKREVISEVEPSWKDKCNRCYKMGEMTRRACSRCHQIVINGNEPTWMTMCKPCFKASRQSVN